MENIVITKIRIPTIRRLRILINQRVHWLVENNRIDDQFLPDAMKVFEKVIERNRKAFRNLAISFFILFVAVSGGNVEIKALGVSLIQIPKFEEICVLLFSGSLLIYSLSFIEYVIQMNIINSILSIKYVDDELAQSIYYAKYVSGQKTHHMFAKQLNQVGETISPIGTTSLFFTLMEKMLFLGYLVWVFLPLGYLVFIAWPALAAVPASYIVVAMSAGCVAYFLGTVLFTILPAPFNETILKNVGDGT